MKVDVGLIDLERFHVNQRSLPGVGDVLLIVPQKGSHRWEEHELHLRSLLCRPDGIVISSGFGKFFNCGENVKSDNIVSLGLAGGRSSIKEKLDGSLIIRSVIDGTVNLRTRGCENIAENMRDAVMRLIGDEHPWLLDPAVEPNEGKSLLMEYIAPENQIVVRYDRPQLIGLGWSVFDGDDLIITPLLSALGTLKPVRSVILPNDIVGLRQVVAGLEGEEGVVVWTQTATGAHLCKFKSLWYMRLHALRSQATPRYMREYCVLNGISTLDELKNALFKEGFDWELVKFAEPIFNEFKAEYDTAMSRLVSLHAAMSACKMHDMPTRKDKALKAQELAGCHGNDMFGYMMAASTGDVKLAAEIADALCVCCSVNELRAIRKRGVEKLGSGSVIDDG